MDISVLKSYVGDDNDLIVNMLDLFSTELLSARDFLFSYKFDKTDFAKLQMLRTLAHKLRGVCGYYGANKLGEYSRMIESALIDFADSKESSLNIDIELPPILSDAQDEMLHLLESINGLKKKLSLD